jgi:hypothetical protein
MSKPLNFSLLVSWQQSLNMISSYFVRTRSTRQTIAKASSLPTSLHTKAQYCTIQSITPQTESPSTSPPTPPSSSPPSPHPPQPQTYPEPTPDPSHAAPQNNTSNTPPQNSTCDSAHTPPNYSNYPYGTGIHTKAILSAPKTRPNPSPLPRERVGTVGAARARARPATF